MTVAKNLKSLLRPPSPSFNYQARFVRKWLRGLLAAGDLVLDLGSGSRELVPGVINIDLAVLPGVHMVGDAQMLPIKSGSLHAVVCSALLEHVADPEQVVREVHRCVRKHGEVYFEVPFLQPAHLLSVGDYRRYTLQGISALLSRFKCKDMGVCIGPFSVLAWYLRKTPTVITKSESLREAIEFIFGWLTFWIKYLDILCVNAPCLDICSAGVFFYGNKDSGSFS